jgi:hypothetical protein
MLDSRQVNLVNILLLLAEKAFTIQLDLYITTSDNFEKTLIIVKSYDRHRQYSEL